MERIKEYEVIDLINCGKGEIPQKVKTIESDIGFFLGGHSPYPTEDYVAIVIPKDQRIYLVGYEVPCTACTED